MEDINEEIPEQNHKNAKNTIEQKPNTNYQAINIEENKRQIQEKATEKRQNHLAPDLD